MSKHFTPKIFAPLTQHTEIFPLLFFGVWYTQNFPPNAVLANTLFTFKHRHRLLLRLQFFSLGTCRAQQPSTALHPAAIFPEHFFLPLISSPSSLPACAFFHFYFSGTHTILDFGACTAHSLYHYSSAAHFERNCAHGFRPMLHSSIRSLSTADWLTLFF